MITVLKRKKLIASLLGILILGGVFFIGYRYRIKFLTEQALQNLVINNLSGKIVGLGKDYLKISAQLPTKEGFELGRPVPGGAEAIYTVLVAPETVVEINKAGDFDRLQPLAFSDLRVGDWVEVFVQDNILNSQSLKADKLVIFRR